MPIMPYGPYPPPSLRRESLPGLRVARPLPLYIIIIIK